MKTYKDIYIDSKELSKFSKYRELFNYSNMSYIDTFKGMISTNLIDKLELYKTVNPGLTGVLKYFLDFHYSKYKVFNEQHLYNDITSFLHHLYWSNNIKLHPNRESLTKYIIEVGLPIFLLPYKKV